MKILANETCERFTKEGGDTGEEIYKVSLLTLYSIITRFDPFEIIEP